MTMVDRRRPQRIDRLLASLGYCSRRSAVEFLGEHRVTIGGERIRDGSIKASPDDIAVDGTLLDNPDGLLILLNKPAGYVCSHDASEGRLVYELIEPQWMRRNPAPSTVGRLDKETTGAILITDITGINHAFTSPRRAIDKVYRVVVDRPLSAEVASQFASGTMVLSGETRPCRAATLDIIDDFRAEITLHEGKYHQVRRMFGYCGYRVEKLHRLRFGPYSVDDIPEGKYVLLPPSGIDTA